MIRIFQVYFASRTLLLAFSEVLLLTLASLPAAVVVLGTDARSMFFDSTAIPKLMLVVCVCMALMHYFDLYDSMILFKPAQGAVRVLQMLGVSCVILSVIYHLYPAVQINPNLMVVWIIVAGLSLIIWRKLFIVLNQSSRHSQRVLLWGTGPLSSILFQEIESRPELGIDVAGYVDSVPVMSEPFRKLEHWSNSSELKELFRSEKIQRVVVATEDGAPPELTHAARELAVAIDQAPELYEAITGRVDLSSLRPSMLLFFKGFRHRPLIKLYKRTASIVGSLLGLVAMLPVMFAIALAIRMESAGPAIFRQNRIGKGGKTFTLFKFRSMYDSAGREGQFKPAEVNDPRCTRIGKWLRRTRLDELPQLYNILRGDMDFIGPRPFAIDEEEHLAREIPFYEHRWAIRPGATGWAQVRKGYNETIEDNVEKLAYDLYYIKHLSVGLDLLIIVESIKIVLLGRGAH